LSSAWFISFTCSCGHPERCCRLAAPPSQRKIKRHCWLTRIEWIPPDCHAASRSDTGGTRKSDRRCIVDHLKLANSRTSRSAGCSVIGHHPRRGTQPLVPKADDLSTPERGLCTTLWFIWQVLSCVRTAPTFSSLSERVRSNPPYLLGEPCRTCGLELLLATVRTSNVESERSRTYLEDHYTNTRRDGLPSCHAMRSDYQWSPCFEAAECWNSWEGAGENHLALCRPAQRTALRHPVTDETRGHRQPKQTRS